MAGNFRGHTFNALMQPNAVDDRPLAFRSTLAPFGTYANPDGSESVGLAWPGAVTEPLNALQRLAENSRFEDGRIGIPNPQDPGNQEDMVTALLGIYGGNALNPAAAIPKNSVGMFAGRMAKTADHGALAKAEQMASSGADRNAIWNETGWFQGPDQKWRFEIDDSKSYTDLSSAIGDGMAPGDRWPLGTVLGHKDLFSAYPKLDETGIQYRAFPDGYNDVGGSYAKNGDQVLLNSNYRGFADDNAMHPFILHEGQHRIQAEEGFARGGNDKSFTPDQLAAERARLMSVPEDATGWTSIGTSAGDMPDRDVGRSLYKRLAGETEARNVQKRMNMTAEERRATPPWETQDVPDDQQIVRFLSDTGRPSMFGSAVAAENASQKGITAYHGSPHDFDKFSLDKIGTGEGAQAYGHGLYFAENEGVANSYRRKLSQGYSDGIGMAREALMLTGGDFEKAIAHVLRGKDSYGKRWGNDPNRLPFGKLYDDAVRELRLKPEGLAPSGHMYQVKINANPEDFLDWDKPLSQQPQAARSAIESDPIFSTEMYSSAPDNTMRNLLRDPSTTAKLREAGIPGIKYLDQMSRAAGDGSRNYVVFDDSLIEILKKYGLAGGVLGASSLFDFNTDQQY